MIYIILAIVILLVIYFIICYNSFVNLNNRVKEAFSTMDVYLKKRWDLIPNLVEVVKGYASHESETLKEIVNLRNEKYDGMSMNDKIKTNEKISSSIGSIMAIAENYPDLKASSNFMALSDSLNSIENDIANARKYYNGVVKSYNNKVEMFPSNLVAKMLGYKPMEMFVIDSESRENVKVNL